MRLGMFNLRGDQHRFSIEKLKNDKGEESLISFFSISKKVQCRDTQFILYIYIYIKERVFSEKLFKH